jgi:NAD(P)-dependent dehydrogenase (short-subunit alcohol dehydrogenase family)
MRRRVRNVMVSGACGGLGFAVAMGLAARGVATFAADSDRNALSRREWPPGSVPIFMDVTDCASVARAVKEASELLGKDGSRCLDGLVCCAGIFTGGPLVEVGEGALVRAFDVNVLGAFRLVREAFPLLAAGAGTVVLISSESARFAMPFNGPYTIGKYALEAYADCLRRELLLTGVRISVVQPGSIRTALLRNAGEEIHARASGSAFSDQLAKVGKLLRREWEKGMEPQRVAHVVVRALFSSAPRHRYRTGNDPLRLLLRAMPARTADALIRLFMR